jgi:hypothetical protein
MNEHVIPNSEFFPDYETSDYAMLGKSAEAKAIIIFDRLGITYKDVRLEDQYQKEDIDFLTERNGLKFKVEVKYDYYLGRSGNMFFETERIYAGGTTGIGWSIKSKANRFWLWSPFWRSFLVVNSNSFRSSKENYIKDCEKNGWKLRTVEIPTNKDVTTKGILVPQKYLIDDQYKIIHYEEEKIV